MKGVGDSKSRNRQMFSSARKELFKGFAQIPLCGQRDKDFKEHSHGEGRNAASRSQLDRSRKPSGLWLPIPSGSRNGTWKTLPLGQRLLS